MCYTEVVARMIRASEIGTYTYCARAWWYQHRGIGSSNQVALADGTTAHRQHGRSVLLTDLARALGLLALLAALILLIASGIDWLF